MRGNREDDEIWPIIHENASLPQQFNDPDVKNNEVCVILPLVRRYAGYKPHQLDIDVLHPQTTELGQLELYRVKDFIHRRRGRQKVDMGPVLHTAQVIAGVEVKKVLESIKRQIQFLQRPENQDLPMAPAQILNS